MRFNRSTSVALAGVLSLGLLTACSSSSDDSTTTKPSGTAGADQVTITVAGLEPGAKQDAVDQLNARVAAFETKYPDIKVEPQEYKWLASTFTTQLAGGTLPTVFEIPLTDGKTLIQNGQLADIDAQFKELSYAGDFNKEALAAGTGDDGKVYAIPAKSFYDVTLHYNRDLFTQAGLDPDKPPATWDEIRTDAKAIYDATGVPGYGMMALDNAGGWQLTAAAYSRGGRVQTTDGKTYTATLTDPAVKAQLQWLKDLRWEDNSIYPGADLGWGDINAAFAAGQIAMFTSGSDIYNALVENNGVTADFPYGLAPIPVEGADAGALTGGTFAAVKVDATDAEKEAAVKWIDFWYLSPLLDQTQAVDNATTRAAANQAVGTPVLPIFSRDQYELSLSWVKDQINVPLDHMKPYTDVMFDQPLVGEPSRSTQPTYGLLYPIVQAVLTDKNADIDALLATANTQDQALIDQGKEE
ncbi:ABC-type glycerol-3-phosphate transport system, substrate-binding protein [Sanguibacter gelidistatuariae]|uniref:ABC-type glycerol-3-phosphate transport system, substrate-binding protein n=1 Tax=Sanguibacter gelidistatuariae TaxID=1814289 RepID=A0A1G6JZJ3_9MICO|nr:extracellular solute-binding protein [Sanguibacter gelidistatuariae]SDC24160.1 ABC-type glycerol-3-phosphate transport system, substrate-binding protein [Sanguibacter gelidistatuariae]